jgi:hypothetical protein
MIASAAMAALGLTLPVVFHAVGLGSKFAPMMLPLLLNGFLSPFSWAVLTGALVPLVSALFTGMPPLYPPVALLLSLEGALAAGVAAVLYRVSRRVWLALIAAMVCGRAASFVLTWFAARWFGLPPAMASLASLMQGLPGIALQLAVIPLVVRALARRRSILFHHGHESEATLLQ